MNRYFEAGVEVDSKRHSELMCGMTGKLIRCAHAMNGELTGTALAVLSDLIHDKDGKLDTEDALLQLGLDAANVTLDKSYIVFRYGENKDFLDGDRTHVFGLW